MGPISELKKEVTWVGDHSGLSLLGVLNCPGSPIGLDIMGFVRPKLYWEIA